MFSHTCKRDDILQTPHVEQQIEQLFVLICADSSDSLMSLTSLSRQTRQCVDVLSPINESEREVGGWGRDPQKCTGRDWGMGPSTI